MIDGADELYKGDDGTALRFFEEAIKNNFQTEKNGRPIFDTALMVEVMTPGSTESIPKFMCERKYCDEAGKDAEGNNLFERTPYYVRFQKQIEAYRAQNGNFADNGMPIGQWPQIDVGTAASLKAAGIHTVEALATVSDGNLQNLGTGGRVLRDQAAGYVQTQQFGIPTAKMAADSANLREENIRLQNTVTDLTQRLSQAQSELQAARNGSLPPVPAAGGPSEAALDPLSTTTISQPNALATMDSSSASPLTPSEGEAKDVAKDRAENAQMASTDQFGTLPPAPAAAPPAPPTGDGLGGFAPPAPAII